MGTQKIRTAIGTVQKVTAGKIRMENGTVKKINIGRMRMDSGAIKLIKFNNARTITTKNLQNNKIYAYLNDDYGPIIPDNTENYEIPENSNIYFTIESTYQGDMAVKINGRTVARGISEYTYTGGKSIEVMGDRFGYFIVAITEKE